MIRVQGHPNLRKDRLGVIHNVDKQALEEIHQKKEVCDLKAEVRLLKKLVQEYIEKK